VPTFIDTNVLAYAHDASEQHRQPIAVAIIDDLWRSREGVLSTQVLTEFYVVVTRKFKPPLSRREARRLIDAYTAWPVIQVDPPLIIAASALEEQHSLSFWDALIVEAARRAGADRLVSEDLQHSRRIAGLVIDNPFIAADPQPGDRGD
jgi:predicted nucleic acid-binding protein